MARIKGQEYRWIIVARYEDKNEYLLLKPPLRLPIFTTTEKAKEFRRAVAQVMDKSLPIRLTVSERKWPWRGLQYVTNPNCAVFDPPTSACQRAVLMIRGVEPDWIIPLVRA